LLICAFLLSYSRHGCVSVLTSSTQALVRSKRVQGWRMLSLKTILVVADGLADRPLRELGWKTPLEAASRPVLDQIAKTGICGIIDPIAPGIPPGSDTATLAILGYDPLKCYSGRGALEALGSGMTVLSSDVAFRCNFATVNENLVVLDRRAGRIANEDATKLAAAIQKVKLPKSFKAKFLFKNTVQHRAALVLRGPKLSSAISDSDPEMDGKKVLQVKPLDKSKEAERTARIVNALTHEFRRVLRAHPVNRLRAARRLPEANEILFRGAGTVPKIVPLHEEFGIKPACVAAVSLIKGVCQVAGMSMISVKGANGTPLTDYLGKAKAAVHALRAYDFVFLHVKAADVASHDGNVKLKIEVIEKIDKMLGYVLDHVDADSTFLAVTADHTTPIVTRNHEGDPVPVAIAGPYVRRDSVTEFGERACACGGLNRMRGVDLMPTLMSLMGKAKKFGA
jgi:2,3-bisphosphoglycerate-independent phosphoglycerate mutase